MTFAATLIAASTLTLAAAAADPSASPATATTRATTTRAATQPPDPYAAYVADYAAFEDEVFKALAPVKSVADARAAVPTVRHLIEANAALAARARELPPLSPAARDRMKERSDDRLASAADRACREVDRLTDDPVLSRLFEPDGHGFLKPTAEAIRPAATTRPVVAATGAADSDDALAADYAAWLADAARTVAAVRTPADARAAIPAVRRLDEAVAAFRVRARRLVPNSPEVAERIRAEFHDRVRAAEPFDLDVYRVARDPTLNGVLCSDGDGFLMPTPPTTRPAGTTRPAAGR